MSPTSFNISQIESPMYTASSTGNDTYTATLSPAPTSLVTGQKVRLRFTTANTGACSLNLNSLGAINIKTRGGNDPVDGDITATSIRELTYDGTNFVLDYNKATTAEPGCVEMATDAEALAGTDETRYVNPKQAKPLFFTTANTTNISAGNVTTTITHSLGRTPSYINMQIGFGPGNSSSMTFYSNGYYVGGTQNCMLLITSTLSGPSAHSDSVRNTGIIGYLQDGSTSSSYSFVINNVTTNSFDLVCTRTGTGNITVSYQVFLQA